MTDAESVCLLVVDDDEVDREVVARALNKSGLKNPLYAARDGIEALEILRGQGADGPLPRPFLILLDWNMPRMNGKEFLEQLREDEALSDSIVFVFTTSDAFADKEVAFKLRVAGYIVKDRVERDFSNLMSMLSNYCKLVEFPLDK